MACGVLPRHAPGAGLVLGRALMDAAEGHCWWRRQPCARTAVAMGAVPLRLVLLGALDRLRPGPPGSSRRPLTGWLGIGAMYMRRQRISGPTNKDATGGRPPAAQNRHWRRGRDSNPRRCDPHTISNRAHSAGLCYLSSIHATRPLYHCCERVPNLRHGVGLVVGRWGLVPGSHLANVKIRPVSCAREPQGLQSVEE